MARRKKHDEHVNHERWLVSYADFITLLFAFFVVMFAVSRVDTQRAGRFSAAFSAAVGVDMFPNPGHGLMSGTNGPNAPTTPQEARGDSALPEELEGVATALAEQRAAGRDELTGLVVIRRRQELVLRLPEALLFESGTAAVQEPATRTLARIAEQLRPRRVDVRVEGHTDDRPVRGRASRFTSNWELSTARATAVLASLAGDHGILPERLSAAGYGEFRPAAPNATDEGRRQNRRVDLVLTVAAPSPSP